MSPRFVAGLSSHPTPAVATAEVVGQLQDYSVEPPSVVVVFVTGRHQEFSVKILATIEAVASPEHLFGCCAPGVIGQGELVGGADAISLWAAWDLPVEPLFISAAGSTVPCWDGLPDHIDAGSVAVVLASATDLAPDLLAREFNNRYDEVVLCGGIVTNPQGHPSVLASTPNQLGAVGFVLPPGAAQHHHVRHPSALVLSQLSAPAETESNLLFQSAGVGLRDAVWSEHGSMLFHDAEVGHNLAGMLTTGEFACRDGHNASHLFSAGLVVFTNS